MFVPSPSQLTGHISPTKLQWLNRVEDSSKIFKLVAAVLSQTPRTGVRSELRGKGSLPRGQSAWVWSEQRMQPHRVWGRTVSQQLTTTRVALTNRPKEKPKPNLLQTLFLWLHSVLEAATSCLQKDKYFTFTPLSSEVLKNLRKAEDLFVPLASRIHPTEGVSHCISWLNRSQDN